MDTFVSQDGRMTSELVHFSSVAGPTVVTVARREDGVAVLRLDSPPRNALSTVALRQVEAAANQLIADPPGAVVVWGGPQVFSAGGDPTEFDHFDSAVGRYVGERFHAATDALAAIPRPTIAAVAGMARGGGLELALACDFRVATGDAELGQHEMTMGLFPGGGGTQRLPRLVGPAHAKRLIYSGQLVGAEEALRIGLIDRVAADGPLLAAALAWAGELAAGPAATRGLVKQVIDRGLDLPLPEALRLELDIFPRLFENWG
jgi:enoyl-CoA hydratase/carnithine racemase